MESHTCFLSLGSNLGDRAQHLQAAYCELAHIEQTQIVAQSRIYETDPVDFTDQAPFFNAVVMLKSFLAPEQLLAACLEIEQRLGRVRTVRYGPRVIDLDVLFYDDWVMNQEKLQVPHARLHERAFVLVPMMELAPLWLHPTLQLTIAQLYERVDGKEGVRLCPSYLRSDCAHTES